MLTSRNFVLVREIKIPPFVILSLNEKVPTTGVNDKGRANLKQQVLSIFTTNIKKAN